jgi:beta-glucuronidase
MMFSLRRALLTCLAAFAAAGLAGTSASADPIPAGPALGQPIVLSDGWQYAPDPSFVGLKQGWAYGHGDPAWRPTTVPSVFNATPVDYAGTVGWYRTTFTAPDVPGAVSWALHFEQVRRTAEVWVNGVPVGKGTDGYTPFTLLASGVRVGQPNQLVVRVDNRKPADLREGWWNWGGITRQVSLVPTGSVRLSDLAIMPNLSCHPTCTAKVHVLGTATAFGSAAVSPTMTVTMTAPSGRVTTKSVSLGTLAPGKPAAVSWNMAVPSPQLWSPQQPDLYNAVATVTVNGVAQQATNQQVGLRSVLVRHGRLLLNGRVLNVRGASIIEDMPGHGPALTDSDMDQIVSELQSLHANITRSHYLLNEGLLERLDRAGILVWEQAPVYHRDKQLRTAAGRSTALTTLRRTILADRMHPSVIVNSVANELSPTPDSVPGTKDYLLAAAKLERKLDPTRPVALDVLTYTGFGPQKTYKAFDAIGVNTYFGWYTGKSGGHSTADLAALETYLNQTHRRYPNTALVMTEFGAEATRHGPTSEKGSYEFQEAYLRNVLGIVSRLHFVDGAIYWTLREFAVKPDWTGGASPAVVTPSPIHHKGLISYDGTEKPAFSLAQQLFEHTPMYK